MQVKKLAYSSRFRRNLRRLSPEVVSMLDERLEIFKLNTFDRSLKTHKLKGKWRGCWSFSVNYSYRIVFEFQAPGEVGLIDVGDHAIYQ